MIALEIISDEIPALSVNDTCDKAAVLLDEFKMTHLPVVNEDEVCLGLIGENDVYDIDDFGRTLGENRSMIRPVFVEETDHVFTVITKMADLGTSCMPVVNDKNILVGSTTVMSMMKIIGETALVRDEGGIIELEMNIIDYSLSEIARIVESNNAKILGSYIRNHADSKKLHVTLKINRTDLTPIIKTFERYEYDISASFHQSEGDTGLQDRFNNLMNYLNL